MSDGITVTLDQINERLARTAAFTVEKAKHDADQAQRGYDEALLALWNAASLRWEMVVRYQAAINLDDLARAALRDSA